MHIRIQKHYHTSPPMGYGHVDRPSLIQGAVPEKETETEPEPEHPPPFRHRFRLSIGVGGGRPWDSTRIDQSTCTSSHWHDLTSSYRM